MTTLIEMIQNGKGESLESDFAALETLANGDRKVITSYLTILGYRAGEIVAVTKELARARTTSFEPAFRQAIIDGEIEAKEDVEAFIRASDSATENTLRKKAYFERDYLISVEVRKNERAKVLAELDTK